jgi:hypothetical protein
MLYNADVLLPVLSLEEVLGQEDDDRMQTLMTHGIRIIGSESSCLGMYNFSNIPVIGNDGVRFILFGVNAVSDSLQVFSQDVLCQEPMPFDYEERPEELEIIYTCATRNQPTILRIASTVEEVLSISTDTVAVERQFLALQKRDRSTWKSFYEDHRSMVSPMVDSSKEVVLDFYIDLYVNHIDHVRTVQHLIDQLPRRAKRFAAVYTPIAQRKKPDGGDLIVMKRALEGKAQATVQNRYVLDYSYASLARSLGCADEVDAMLHLAEGIYQLKQNTDIMRKFPLK